MTNNRKPVKVLPAACVSGTAISSMGMAAPPPVESTTVPPPQPSQRIYPERVPVRGSTLPEFNSVSLSLCQLLLLKYQGVVGFYLLQFIILIGDLQAPVFTLLLIFFASARFYSSKGLRWKVKHWHVDWRWKKKHVWMTAVYGTCMKEVCSRDISGEKGEK